MEPYDLVMLAVLAMAVLFGAMRGFAWQLASIASIGLSYFVAYRYREPFSQMIHADPPWNHFLAMLILFLTCSLLVWLAFRLVSSTIDRLKLKEFDRHVGAAFGLIKGALYCVLITFFVVTLANEPWKQRVIQSRSGYYIARLLDKSEAVMPPELKQVVGPYLQQLDQQLRGAGGAAVSDQSVQLYRTGASVPGADGQAGWQWAVSGSSPGARLGAGSDPYGPSSPYPSIAAPQAGSPTWRVGQQSPAGWPSTNQPQRR
jgi:membrane protein required for colicin V production